MTCILTQDRQNIINADSVERISVDAGVICAHTLGGAVVTIGTFEKPESVTKVMTYIAFSFASSSDKEGKTIVIPSEEVVGNDKAIAENLIKAMLAKKAEGQPTAAVDLSPELKAFIEKMKGGDSK